MKLLWDEVYLWLITVVHRSFKPAQLSPSLPLHLIIFISRPRCWPSNPVLMQPVRVLHKQTSQQLGPSGPIHIKRVVFSYCLHTGSLTRQKRIISPKGWYFKQDVSGGERGHSAGCITLAAVLCWCSIYSPLVPSSRLQSDAGLLLGPW